MPTTALQPYSHAPLLTAAAVPPALVVVDDVLGLLAGCDRFKHINDRHGHGTGGRILVALARRLHRCVPAEAAWPRLGGGEFAAIVRLPCTDAGRELLGLCVPLKEPVPHADALLAVSSSVGVAHTADLTGRPMCRVESGEAAFVCLGAEADAAAASVDGRRSG